VSPRGAFFLELRIESANGRRRAVRLGRTSSALLLVAALAAVIGAAVGIFLLPSAFAGSRLRRETSVALERRTQLGDRLRSLAERYTELERRAREHGARVDRIRQLYGLPPIAATGAVPASRPAPEGSIFDGAILYGRRADAAIEASLARTDALLATLALWERERPKETRAVPAMLPIPAADAVPVSGFGPRRDPVTGEPEFHAGLDLAAPAGATIRAPADGIVRWAGEPPPSAGERWWRLGRVVVLADGELYRTILGHCDRILVRAGQHVERGMPIATVGVSGWTPTPRLHFEVRRRDDGGQWQAIDPLRMLLDTSWVPAATPDAEAIGAEPGPPPPELPSIFAR